MYFIFALYFAFPWSGNAAEPLRIYKNKSGHSVRISGETVLVSEKEMQEFFVGSKREKRTIFHQSKFKDWTVERSSFHLGYPQKVKLTKINPTNKITFEFFKGLHTSDIPLRKVYVVSNKIAQARCEPINSGGSKVNDLAEILSGVAGYEFAKSKSSLCNSSDDFKNKIGKSVEGLTQNSSNLAQCMEKSGEKGKIIFQTINANPNGTILSCVGADEEKVCTEPLAKFQNCSGTNCSQASGEAAKPKIIIYYPRVDACKANLDQVVSEVLIENAGSSPLEAQCFAKSCIANKSPNACSAQLSESYQEMKKTLNCCKLRDGSSCFEWVESNLSKDIDFSNLGYALKDQFDKSTPCQNTEKDSETKNAIMVCEKFDQTIRTIYKKVEVACAGSESRRSILAHNEADKAADGQGASLVEMAASGQVVQQSTQIGNNFYTNFKADVENNPSLMAAIPSETQLASNDKAVESFASSFQPVADQVRSYSGGSTSAGPDYSASVEVSPTLASFVPSKNPGEVTLRIANAAKDQLARMQLIPISSPSKTKTQVADSVDGKFKLSNDPAGAQQTILANAAKKENTAEQVPSRTLASVPEVSRKTGVVTSGNKTAVTSESFTSAEKPVVRAPAGANSSSVRPTFSKPVAATTTATLNPQSSISAAQEVIKVIENKSPDEARKYLSQSERYLDTFGIQAQMPGAEPMGRKNTAPMTKIIYKGKRWVAERVLPHQGEAK